MLQMQEHITALHNVCQQLDSSAIGKAAETRLQKALDKLHKIQQTAVSAAPDSTWQHAKTEQVINPVQDTAARPQPSEVGNSVVSTQPDSVSEPASSHFSNGQDAVMADAAALDGARPAADAQDVVLLVKAEGASVQNMEHAAAAADKSKTAADKKAQKEEAKVGSLNVVQVTSIRTCMFSLACVQQFKSTLCMQLQKLLGP